MEELAAGPFMALVLFPVPGDQCEALDAARGFFTTRSTGGQALLTSPLVDPDHFKI